MKTYREVVDEFFSKLALKGYAPTITVEFGKVQVTLVDDNNETLAPRVTVGWPSPLPMAPIDALIFGNCMVQASTFALQLEAGIKTDRRLEVFNSNQHRAKP